MMSLNWLPGEFASSRLMLGLLTWNTLGGLAVRSLLGYPS